MFLPTIYSIAKSRNGISGRYGFKLKGTYRTEMSLDDNMSLFDVDKRYAGSSHVAVQLVKLV